MAIREGTAYYENYKGYDLNYYLHDGVYCVYIGDILHVLGQATKRGNYGDIAYKYLKMNIDFYEFKLNEAGWNRVYLTKQGISKLYKHYAEINNAVKEKVNIIGHCNGIIDDLASNRIPSSKPVKKPSLESECTDSYVADLIEDVDSKINTLDSKINRLKHMIESMNIIMLTHDLNLQRESIAFRSMFVGTMQCLIDSQINNPLAKNKDLKSRLKNISMMLSRESSQLKADSKHVEEREKKIEDYRRSTGHLDESEGKNKDEAAESSADS